jgi:hypothetical protein
LGKTYARARTSLAKVIGLVDVVAAVTFAGLSYLCLYAGVWGVYWVAGLLSASPDVEWGLEEVQARVVTLGESPATVQRTVDALPDGLGSVYVVSERPIEVDGAAVAVVDPEFSTRAVAKARALEWARRTLPREEEYVLLLDEDTVVDEFSGLPDADVVQFAERPGRNGSMLTWLTEVFRVGNGVERAGFGALVPLYAWGGGLAIRGSVEDGLQWNRATIVEDSSFVRDAVAAGYSYAVVMTRFSNQSPPTVGDLVAQRRRWSSGRLREVRSRPLAYRSLLYLHTVGRPLTAFSVPLVVAGGLLAPTWPLLGVLAGVGLAALLLWTVLGWREYDESFGLLAVLVLALPVTTLLNGLGDAYALVSPVSEFQATAKRDPDGRSTTGADPERTVGGDDSTR